MKSPKTPYKKALYLCFVLAPLFLLTGCGSLGLTAENFTMASVFATGGCWPCTMFKVVWESIGSAFSNTYPTSAQLASILLGVGLLFWLSFTICKMVISLKEPNMKDYIPKIAGVLFKALVVGVILSNPNYMLYILDLIMSPVLEAFTKLSTSIIGSKSEWFKLPFSDSDIEKNYAIFTRNIGSQMQDIVYQLYLHFKSGFFLGARMMMHFEFMAIITGGLIMSMFFYFMLFFPLIILEGFISIGFVLIMFPFFMAGWVFPPTKGYITESIKILFQGVAQILVTCIYISIIIAIIEEYSDSFSITKSLTDPSLLLGLNNMSNNGLAMLGLIYAMFKLTNDVPNITSFFVGEMNRSVILRTFSRAAGVAKNIGKIAIGGALAGTGVMGAVGKGMMASGAKDMAKDSANWVTDGAGNGGMSEAEKRASVQK